MLRLWRAFWYSVAGLRDAWRHPAPQLEIVLMAIAIPIAVLLPVTVIEKLLLMGSLVAIFVVELLNTSVEAAIDRIGPERHELSRLAKDLGSAAVFVASVFAAVVWIALAAPIVIPWFARG